MMDFGERMPESDVTPDNSRLTSNTLRKDLLCTLFGNFIYRGCQWGILIALAKFTTAKEVGKFALGLAIVTPIVMFAQLHLRTVHVTDVRSSYEFEDYLGLRLLGATAVLLISSVVAVAGYDNIYTVTVIILVAAAKIVESISDIIYGVFQKHMRMDIVAKSMVIKGTTSLIIFATVVWFTRSVIWGTFALGVSWLCVVIVYDLPRARDFCEVRPKFRAVNLGRLAKLAAPLGVVMGLIYLQSSVPKYFVEKYFGEAALGYFAAISYVTVVGNMFIMALGQSASARLARHFRFNQKAFKLLVIKLVFAALLIGLALVGLGMAFGEWFLTIVYTPEYAEYSNIFILLLISCAIAFIGSVFGYSITAARRFKIQVPQNGLAVLTAIICSYFLIPRYGLVGGAWTLLIANSVRTLCAAMILCDCVRKRSRL